MTRGKSDGNGKFKQPAQGVPKHVKFVMNLESDSRNVTFGEISDKVRFRHGDGSYAQRNALQMDIKGVLSRKDVQVRQDGVGFNCVADVNQREQEEQEARGGMIGDGQELSEEDESRNNEVVDDFVEGNWRPTDVKVQPQGSALPQQQPLPQGPVIRWERFLAQRCLKVLLVENDDSTRQVVSALLRNCSYEVTAVANGQQAWKLLEDPSNHFDLVLTEVFMPVVSGIGLLGKIMSHQICKTIPVIMMSTHDSMGIVFKCLSKGAVDFLVKPVRKNELKNLWQHVWRRCHSSSGSGSETGSQTKNAVTPNNEADPDNNTGSNDDSDDASIGLNVRDGSDNGSGTQSSWTKRAIEVESPRHRNEWDLDRSHSSTIAQAIQPKIGIVQNEWMPMAGTSRECQDEKPYDFAMGKDLEIAVHGQTDVETEHHQDDKVLCDQACAREDNATLGSSAEGDEIEDPMDTDGSLGKIATKAADLIGTIASKPKSRNIEPEDNGSGEVLEKGVNAQMKDKMVADYKHLPFLELTLKRPRQNGEEDVEAEDRHVLRQSGVSAFSRYNTSGTQVSHPSGDSFQPNSLSKGYGGQCCMTSGSLERGKTGSVHATVPMERAGSSKGSGGDASTPAPVNNQLSQSSNNQDLGSSVVGPGQDMFPRSMPSKDDMLSAANEDPQTGKVISMHQGVMSYDRVPAVYGPGVHPIYYSHTGPPLWGSEAQNPSERGDMCNNSTQTEQLLCPRVHHHHHHVQHVHHHHHHHQNRQHKHAHEHPNQNDHTMNNVTMTAPRCGSSNMVGCAPDANNGQSGSNNGYGSNGNGNGSVNGSASGSNNGSNGQNGHSNGQSSAAVTPGTNGESDTGVGVKSTTGGGGGGGGGSGSGVDQNRSAQREAALTKFRQKRKERCFEKKVRYQSRKRLAEQRPRVRGQFVRQTIYEHTSEAD